MSKNYSKNRSILNKHSYIGVMGSTGLTNKKVELKCPICLYKKGSSGSTGKKTYPYRETKVFFIKKNYQKTFSLACVKNTSRTCRPCFLGHLVNNIGGMNSTFLFCQPPVDPVDPVGAIL